MRLKKALKILSSQRDELRTTYNVDSLSVFGSVARDEASEESDIDILVDFSETPGIFGFLQLKTYLEKILSTPVDLVTKNAIKKQMSEAILRDSIHAA
ncbi:MAG: nucleotidyltransferase [Gammaproteobacteria bacterium]|nr:MAG: nucleotidyltransferase [Gammaproteobacteria bacterium]